MRSYCHLIGFLVCRNSDGFNLQLVYRYKLLSHLDLYMASEEKDLLDNEKCDDNLFVNHMGIWNELFHVLFQFCK